MMQDRIHEVTTNLSALASKAKDQFGEFSHSQLNWKPESESWSVAQCFDHLIKTHSLYFPLLQKLATGTATPSVWERYSPFSGFFGNLLIRSLSPDNKKKSKTSPKAYPSASGLDDQIITQYCQHQAALIDHIQKIPPDINPSKTIITSPLLGFVTYSLEDCLTILVVHGQRHYNQAMRVTEQAAFPVRS